MVLALALRDLTAGYDGPVVRADCVVEGQRIAVVGENGSGKSTLLRTIGRVLDPLGGTVEISHSDIAYVGHQPATFPGLTIEECLEYWRRVFEVDVQSWRERARTVMQRWGIEGLANRDCGRLSRGERQLVSLVMSLAQDPEVAVWDEPTSGIDLARRLQMWDAVGSMIGDNEGVWRLQGVIFSTHLGDDLQDATVLEMSDGVAKPASSFEVFRSRGVVLDEHDDDADDRIASSGSYQGALRSVIEHLRRPV